MQSRNNVAPHLVVDAMNVIGSRPTGWWRDRDAAIRRLVERLQGLAATKNCAVTVVIDGHPLLDLPDGVRGGVQVLYASRRGPNGADDRIVEFIQVHAEPASLEVITSDRNLSDRAIARGVHVRGLRSLLAWLDELGC